MPPLADYVNSAIVLGRDLLEIIDDRFLRWNDYIGKPTKEPDGVSKLWREDV